MLRKDRSIFSLQRAAIRTDWQGLQRQPIDSDVVEA